MALHKGLYYYVHVIHFGFLFALLFKKLKKCPNFWKKIEYLVSEIFPIAAFLRCAGEISLSKCSYFKKHPFLVTMLLTNVFVLVNGTITSLVKWFNDIKFKGNAQFVFLCSPPPPKKKSLNVYLMKILKNTVTKKVIVCFDDLVEERFWE